MTSDEKDFLICYGALTKLAKVLNSENSVGYKASEVARVAQQLQNMNTERFMDGQ